MSKRTKEILLWGAIGSAAVLGGAYLLYRANPDLADRVKATWLLEKFRLVPTVHSPTETPPIAPAVYTPPPQPQTVVGEMIFSPSPQPRTPVEEIMFTVWV